MTAPSPAPLCRYCGKPISKRTEALYCYPEPPRTEATDPYSGRVQKLAVPRHRVGVFRTKAELQAACNERVVSIRKNEDGTIWSASTWDGVTYADRYFCSNHHAALFGYACAAAGSAMPAYHEAVARKPKTAG
jgi:hypothetical protein